MSDEIKNDAPPAAPVVDETPVNTVVEPAAPSAPKPKTVPANAALIEWPVDVWGFTSDLKRVGILACSSIRGDETKQKLFLDTVRILALHALARLESDRQEQLVQLERINAAAAGRFQNNSRVAARSVNKEAVQAEQATAPTE